MTQGRRLLLLGLSAIAVAAALADAASGSCSCASHLAPLVLVLLPLLVGCFPGERLIARFVARRATPRAARPRARRRRAPAAGGFARHLLMARHLAGRPPPVWPAVSP